MNIHIRKRIRTKEHAFYKEPYEITEGWIEDEDPKLQYALDYTYISGSSYSFVKKMLDTVLKLLEKDFYNTIAKLRHIIEHGNGEVNLEAFK